MAGNMAGGFPYGRGYPKRARWMAYFHGKTQLEMDDDWGYRYDETETRI